MKTLSATEVVRNFSRILDSLAQGGEEIVVIRNNQPVAKLIPGAPRMTALEALADIYRTLEPEEGANWLEDMKGADRVMEKEVRDPWE
ncbi:MAG: type II toxin-antitoxin system Phd/YefM family antitoxin [Planctomycetes bacterium]|nr:type II toxin-antitoxin system Phd/YefM family antitoxin [Planctomycetota bacterium]